LSSKKHGAGPVIETEKFRSGFLGGVIFILLLNDLRALKLLKELFIKIKIYIDF
jgi:hypothetical protein